MKYQLCPKCHGQGVISRPPGIPWEQLTWTSNKSMHQCDVCNGSKTLLVPDDPKPELPSTIGPTAP